MITINLNPRKTLSGRSLISGCPDYVLDREARELAAREGSGGFTRQQLRDHGYRPISKCSDLHAWGYQIVIWVNLEEYRRAQELGIHMDEGGLCYEYAPRPEHPRTVHNRRPDLPRMTAFTREEQVEAHQAMGAPVWGSQLGLFDA